MRKSLRHAGRAIRRQARQARQEARQARQEILAFRPITLQWVRAYVAGDHAEAAKIQRRRGDMVLALIKAGKRTEDLAPALRQWERAEEVRLGY